MTNPKVTVLMSVYNGERYLRESIDSILSQTFRDFEFIIINDGSTDSAREIIQSCKDSRIRLINNENNIGLTPSLNKGLEIAEGEYIARMDADDVSLPERLEKQVDFLDTNSSIGVLGINSTVIDELGNTVFQVKHPTSHMDIMSKILLDNRFIHSSIMLRKTLLGSLGYYNEDLPMAQDYELFLRLSLTTELSNLPEPLHMWRMNYSTGISVVKRQDQIAVRDQIRRAFLETHFSLNKEYINWVLSNFKENPGDMILSEYLHKISEAVPFTSQLYILKFKIMAMIRFFSGRVIRKLKLVANRG